MALIDKLTAIGDAIRAKTGGTNKLSLDQMASTVTSNLGDVSGVTAGAGDVITGKVIVDASGNEVTGTIKDLAYNTAPTSMVMYDSALCLRIPTGAYRSTGSPDGNAQIKAPQASVASAIGLTAEKIVKGNTILGVAGTATTAAPSGSTITTLNDISIWQKCAGLSTTYTTVAQVVANTNTLKALMNNSNALDYFCRSQTLKNNLFANSTFKNYLATYHGKMSVSTWNAGKDIIAPVTFSASNGITYVDGSFCYTSNCSHNSGTLIGAQSEAGAYIEYNLNGGQIIPWKFDFNSTYVTPDGQNITIKGLTPEGSWVDLSVATAITRNGTAGGAAGDAGAFKEIYCTKTVKCTAVRVVFNQKYSVYPKACKFYYL